MRPIVRLQTEADVWSREDWMKSREPFGALDRERVSRVVSLPTLPRCSFPGPDVLAQFLDGRSAASEAACESPGGKLARHCLTDMRSGAWRCGPPDESLWAAGTVARDPPACLSHGAAARGRESLRWQSSFALTAGLCLWCARRGFGRQVGCA